LFERFLQVSRSVLEEMISRDDLLAIYFHGSYARRDLHLASDIDIVALVRGEGIYSWERREREGVIVSINIRSRDVMERMLASDPWTIVGLQDAEVFYDPKGLIAGYRNRAVLSDEMWRELVMDSFDDACSNLGRAERALNESDPVSAMLCLRESAIKLCEMYVYRDRQLPRNLRHLWKAYKRMRRQEPFEEIFLEVQGLRNISEDVCESAVHKMRHLLESLRKSKLICGE